MKEITNISITMSSREIAELTGKRHDHVIRDIRNMIGRLSATPDLGWHCETETYADEQGKTREMYRMDKDTTLTLVSGYDAVLRFRIIKRWQSLEAQRQPAPKPKPRQLPRKHYLLLQTEVDEVAKWTAQPGRAKNALWEHLRKIGNVENVRYFPPVKLTEALSTLAALKKRTRAFVNDSREREREYIDTILSGAARLPSPAQPSFKLLQGGVS